MHRNLVIVRAGDESLHLEWSKGGQRNFDLFVSYFGTVNERYRAASDYYESVRGLKWPRLAEIFAERRHELSRYDAIWLPDDDLRADASMVSCMFDQFHEFNLLLAQPALGVGSQWSHHITVVHPENRLRFTNFVEIMCPIFSQRALTVLTPSFGSSVSGWGLDFAWPHLLNYPQDRVAILDETPVVHTRPVGSGGTYEQYRIGRINPALEAEEVMKKYGLVHRPEMQVYGSVPMGSRHRH